MTNEIPDGPWALGQGECDGKPMFLRTNTGAARLAGDARYRHRVAVAVPVRAPNPNGFPRPEEATQIDQIEDQLDQALTSAGNSIFVLAITTAGMREFVFYTSDPAASAASVAQLASTVQSHQLQHVVEDDPEWEVYQQFADSTDIA
jgi:hypothetical protein